MRLKNHLLNNVYISMEEKKNKSKNTEMNIDDNLKNDREVKNILIELNRLLGRNYSRSDKNYKFILSKNLKSPTEVLNIKNEKKLESITRK